MYGSLNSLYVNGEINITSNTKLNIKQLLKKLLFIKNDNITYISATKVDKHLNNSLRLLLIMGLLCVSAGLCSIIIIINGIPIINLKYIDSSIYFNIKGSTKNDIIDTIKHIQLLEACRPNATDLIILTIIKNIIISLNIPNKIASMNIIINLVTSI